MRSKAAIFAGLLAAMGWGVDIGTGKHVGNVAASQHRTSTKKKAKKNEDGKRLKSGPKPDKMKFCLAKRKGISGVPKGYLDNRGKATGFNVNGYRGAGLA